MNFAAQPTRYFERAARDTGRRAVASENTASDLRNLWLPWRVLTWINERPGARRRNDRARQRAIRTRDRVGCCRIVPTQANGSEPTQRRAPQRGETMKGSIIDDTTAIGKRLNELTSKQVAVKTATPPPRRLPVCLRCDDTGWMKDGRNWRTCSACSNPLRKPFPDSSWTSGAKSPSP